MDNKITPLTIDLVECWVVTIGGGQPNYIFRQNNEDIVALLQRIGFSTNPTPQTTADEILEEPVGTDTESI